VPGSPAERAGLSGVDAGTGAVGDVIVAANGRPVRRLADLTEQLEQAGVGKTIDLTLSRGGSRTTIKIETTDIGSTR
jgi:2-alkenal reductase